MAHSKKNSKVKYDSLFRFCSHGYCTEVEDAFLAAAAVMKFWNQPPGGATGGSRGGREGLEKV